MQSGGNVKRLWPLFRCLQHRRVPPVSSLNTTSFAGFKSWPITRARLNVHNRSAANFEGGDQWRPSEKEGDEAAGRRQVEVETVAPFSTESDGRVATKTTTKDYIASQPELQKLLADLYQDYDQKEDKERTQVNQSVGEKYSEFADEDGSVVYDVDEERALMDRLRERGIEELPQDKKRQVKRTPEGISATVGSRGVFEVGELALLLRRENCTDVCVLEVDSALAYVDYLCVATCRSHRHMVALAEYLNKVYKHKNNRARGLTLEGIKSAQEGWIAIDMGNIALHIFTAEKREHYDLESLWALGPEFDELSRPSDPIQDFAVNVDGNIILADIKPIS